MIEKIEFGFNHGYTRALMDIQPLIETAAYDLKRFHRKLDEKHIRQFFHLAIEHREDMREKRGGFIRFNAQEKRLEWFNRNEQEAGA